MRSTNQIQTPANRFAGINWIVLLLAMSASSIAAVMLGQDVNWDLYNYHYYAGCAFLFKPLNYDFAPGQLQTFFNPLMHAFTYLILTYLPGKAAAASLGAIQGLNFYLVYLISLTLFRRWRSSNRFLISLGSAFAGFYGAASISELGTTFGDNLISILVLTGLLIILRYFLQENCGRSPVTSLWIGGVIIGAAAGIKLTVSLYVAALFLSLFLLFAKRHFRQIVIFTAALAIGFIATYGIWGISLYLQYQNPFFPHLNNIFHSPYYDWAGAFDDRFLHRNWQQTLLFPFLIAGKNHLASEIDLRDARLAFCYVAIILLAGAGVIHWLRNRGHSQQQKEDSYEVLHVRFLALFISLAYIMWQALFSIYRYQVVLELLIPAFLALVLARFLQNERRALVFSLIIFACIGISVIWPDWGRQKFSDHFLKVTVPPIRNLGKSVVLMAGAEGTSFIVPQFPPSTRFVRVFSNLSSPGLNLNLDKKISAMLSSYDASRMLVYVANPGEMYHTRDAVSFYGVIMDETACFEVRSEAGSQGYVCRVVNGWSANEPKPPEPPWDRPQFQKDSKVRLSVTPKEVVAGKDVINFRVIGIKAQAVDMLYTHNGRWMPPVRGCHLDADQSASFFIGATTGKGLHHYVAIRPSGDENRNLWYQIDTLLLIK